MEKISNYDKTLSPDCSGILFSSGFGKSIGGEKRYSGKRDKAPEN